jgi:Cu(I)/Ag(I) efflux system membrane protein CusA/SilA
MQRIAVPMIGGIVSSTLLTLVVIPAIFGLVKRLPFACCGQAGTGRPRQSPV